MDNIYNEEYVVFLYTYIYRNNTKKEYIEYSMLC